MPIDSVVTAATVGQYFDSCFDHADFQGFDDFVIIYARSQLCLLD